MNFLRWLKPRRHPEPSPFAAQVQQSREVAAELRRVTEQLRRMNEMSRQKRGT